MTQMQTDLVVGALVRWTGAKTYGVIRGIDDRIIHVHWDRTDSPPPSKFAEGRAPLLRVDLKGQRVRQVSTDRSGVVLAPVPSDPPAWSCFLANGSGTAVNVPEADLRPIPTTEPVGRFQEDLIGSLQQYRLQEVTRWYHTLHLHDELVSLGQVGVDIRPHQVSVVHKVVSNYPHRFLLCDEVGLGKTIEAGMILKELRARGSARRVLAIVPPNIVRQWQYEMKTKFNESFSVLNTDTVRYIQSGDHAGNPFTFSDSVLCSSRWVTGPKWAGVCAQVDWDLIIVDEAHHARSYRSGDTTRLYRLVRDLAAPAHFARRAMLLLTAAPMQLDTHELYSLVELLDPALFPSEEHFNLHCKDAPGLSRLVERLSRHGFPLPDQNPGETAKQVAEWLDIDQDTAHRRLSSAADDQAILNELAARHRLSEVLIRNRKVVVGGFMPRVAHRWHVELTVEEQTALEAVEDYVQYGYQLAADATNSALGFLMVTFQKLMASSIAAIKVSLSKRRQKVSRDAQQPLPTAAELEDRIDDDNDASEVAGSVSIASQRELLLLDRALAALDRVRIDSKARVLVGQLSSLFEEDPRAKVLVFTQFRETQRFLQEALTANGWGINVFHGQMSQHDKDSSVERFRNDAGPQILISTEAGGEGRNFQFCHILVNYDLPWNPMRVEQRIGRVDRIGQREAVSIFNLWVQNTIEERVLDVLEKRIKVFEETVGALDPILGDTESDIRKILRIAGKKQEAAFEEFGRQVEERVRHARTAESQLGDFIMDTKSYRRELAERIAGQSSPIGNDDLERFIGRLLSDIGTYIRRSDGVYELTFRGEILDEQDKHFASGPKRRAVFRPDRRTDTEDVEFMTFGHPIVDAIVERVLGETYEGVTGTRRIAAEDDLAPCAGWLFTYQFTIPGVRSTEHLEPVFVGDDGTVDLEKGHKLVMRAFRFDSVEEDISPSEIPNNLEMVGPIADQCARARREVVQQKAESRAAGRIDRELSRLAEWFDYRERAARDRVEATQSTLDRIRESDDESQRQILPVWEANLRRDTEVLDNLAPERGRRIAELEKHRHPQVTWALKSLGRIEVVASLEAKDPDAGLEIREGFASQLQGSLKTVAAGGATHSADQVAKRQGLSW